MTRVTYAADSCRANVVTLPPVPKLPSSVPSALTRTMPKTEPALPAITSLPSAMESFAPALKKPENTTFFARLVMSTKPPAPACR